MVQSSRFSKPYQESSGVSNPKEFAVDQLLSYLPWPPPGKCGIAMHRLRTCMDHVRVRPWVRHSLSRHLRMSQVGLQAQTILPVDQRSIWLSTYLKAFQKSNLRLKCFWLKITQVCQCRQSRDLEPGHRIPFLNLYPWCSVFPNSWPHEGPTPSKSFSSFCRSLGVAAIAWHTSFCNCLGGCEICEIQIQTCGMWNLNIQSAIQYYSISFNAIYSLVWIEANFWLTFQEMKTWP